MFRQRFLKILSALVTGYLIYALLMVIFHPRFLYPFQPDRFAGQGYEQVDIPVDGADSLPVQVVRGAPGAPVIVYFMGNVGALELFRPMLDHHKAAGRSVVAMSYRGAGGVPGRSSENSLKRDALAVFDALPDIAPKGPIHLQGYSLGTGLAVHVAARREVAGVILSAPYLRLCRIMARASYLPACLLPVQRWQTSRDVGDVRAPVLILHGTEDGLVPLSQGRALFEAFQKAGTAPVEMLEIDGAGHNNLLSFPPYLERLERALPEVP